MTRSPSTEAHRRESASLHANCAVVTVSDTRTTADDVSGALAERLFREAGHDVRARTLLRNDEASVRAEILALTVRDDIDAVLVTGGTGLGSRDRSVEAVRPLFEKELPGFGELFRMVSYEEQIGPAAMLSRAVAGSVNGRFVVVLPGSAAAVELALTKLLLPELPHVLRELRR
jgi:molybdenum cofactor biosynthesis protein B